MQRASQSIFDNKYQSSLFNQIQSIEIDSTRTQHTWTFHNSNRTDTENEFHTCQIRNYVAHQVAWQWIAWMNGWNWPMVKSRRVRLAKLEDREASNTSTCRNEGCGKWLENLRAWSRELWMLPSSIRSRPTLCQKYNDLSVVICMICV